MTLETNSRKSSLYILLPILSGACWGMVGVFVRELTKAGLDNPTIVFTRAAFGMILTLLVILVMDLRGLGSRRERSLLYVRLRDFPSVASIAIFGTLLLMPCYNIAVGTLTLSLASILLCTAPVFVLLIGAALFQEKITKKKVLCMVFALIGCAMLSGFFDGGLMDTAGVSLSPFGLIMGLLSALFNAGFIIMSKVVAQKGYNSFTVTFWSFVISTVVLAFFTDWPALLLYMGSAPVKSTLFLLVQSVCTSILPSLAYIVSMRHVEAGRVAILQSGAEPTAAFIAGLLLFSEIPTPAGLIGMVVTIIALMVLAGDRS